MKLGLALRMALRGLGSDRTTSLAAIGIFALGLAAPATFFSILWGGGFRPLPVPEGEQIVRIDVRQPSREGRRLPVGQSDLDAFGDAGALSSVGVFATHTVTLSSRDIGPRRLSAADMTAEVFEILRVEPLMGRLPTESDAETGFVIGYDLWASAFESDADVLGEVVTVGDELRTISAVMPEGFRFPFQQLAWRVLPANRASEGEEVVGRLSTGSSPRTAAVQLDVIWRRADQLRDPGERGGVVRVNAFTRGRGEVGEVVAFGGLVLVGLCLLLIACVNAANLLLVRAADRIQVLAVQAALGASRLQVSAQLLFESLLLCLVGGAVGLGLASLMVDYVQSTMSPANFGYYWMRIAIDGPVVVFTAVLVLGTGVVAGMLPVFRVLQTDVHQVLKGQRASGAFGGFGGWGRYLVVGQLSLSCGALVAAGLAGQAMRAASEFGRELPSDEILMGMFTLDGSGYEEPDARSETIERLAEASGRVQGTRGAALALGAPGYREPWGPLELAGVTYDRPRDRQRIITNAVTPGYFALFDLDVLQGRGFVAADRRGATPVGVISQSLALALAERGDPIGMALRVPIVDSAWVNVVGVVADMALGIGPLVPTAALYLSAHQVDMVDGMILLRAGDDPVASAPGLRRAVAAVDSRLALSSVQSLAEGHRFMTQAQSTLSSLAVSGGLAGLLVAGVGLFGLLSFRVRQRLTELGVRMALGADGWRLGREILTFALRQLAPAVGVGLGLAWLVAPALGPLLLGGDPRSPLTYAAVAAIFLLTGMLAALTPALRAAAVDPIQALRSE